MRIKDDFYPTPAGLIKIALEQFHFIQQIERLKVLDIGAGEGVWGKVLRHIHPNKRFEITGSEINSNFNKPIDYDHWVIGDFLEGYFARESFHYIIGNPPFKGVEKSIRLAFKYLRPYGKMLLLLPIHFMHTEIRVPLLTTDHRPKHIYFVNPRPNFTGGVGNRNDYILVEWHGKHSPYLTTCSSLAWDRKWKY